MANNNKQFLEVSLSANSRILFKFLEIVTTPLKVISSDCIKRDESRIGKCCIFFKYQRARRSPRPCPFSYLSMSYFV